MKKKYKKILAALIVVICLAVFGISLFKPVTAKMEVVRYGNLEKSFTVQAELTPVHSMILSAPAAGSVSDVPFKPGSQVRAGEVLLRTETVLEISTDIQKEQLKQQLSLASRNMTGYTVQTEKRRPLTKRQIEVTVYQRKTTRPVRSWRMTAISPGQSWRCLSWRWYRRISSIFRQRR